MASNARYMLLALTGTQRVLCDELLSFGQLRVYERQRIQVLLLLDSGVSYRDTAAHLGCSSATVSRAVQAYRERSLEGIGKPPAANGKWQERLPKLAQLAAADPPLTIGEIGAALGCDQSVAAKYLRKYGYHKPSLSGGWRWDGRQR